MKIVTCLVVISLIMISTKNIHAVPAGEYFFKMDSNMELDSININAHPVPKNATTDEQSNVTPTVSRPANATATAGKGETTSKADEDEE